MTIEPSPRERVLQAIFDTFVNGGQVTVTTVSALSGVSRQRIHTAGLRPLVARFAAAQHELANSNPPLAKSRISALRTEIELLRHATAPQLAAPHDTIDPMLVAHLRGQIHTLMNQIAALQDEIIAERGAVSLLLRNDT